MEEQQLWDKQHKTCNSTWQLDHVRVKMFFVPKTVIYIKVQLYFSNYITCEECRTALVTWYATFNPLWSAGLIINNKFVIPSSGISTTVAFIAFLKLFTRYTSRQLGRHSRLFVHILYMVLFCEPKHLTSVKSSENLDNGQSIYHENNI